MTTTDYQAKRDALGFEMWILRHAQEQLTAWDQAGLSRTPWDHPILIAVLDSFLVHTRSLIYFFYPSENPHRDDVLPAHFFADGSVRWPHSRDNIPVQVDEWRDNINSALQHLSGRRPHPMVDWPEIAIRAHMDALFTEFNDLGPIGGPIEAVHPNSRTGA